MKIWFIRTKRVGTASSTHSFTIVCYLAASIYLPYFLWYFYYLTEALEVIHYVKGTVIISQHLLQSPMKHSIITLSQNAQNSPPPLSLLLTPCLHVFNWIASSPPCEHWKLNLNTHTTSTTTTTTTFTRTVTKTVNFVIL